MAAALPCKEALCKLIVPWPLSSFANDTQVRPACLLRTMAAHPILALGERLKLYNKINKESPNEANNV